MIHRINCFCIVNESEVDIFCNSLAFSMIQQHMLEISVSSAFFKPIPGTSESSQFKYYWSLLFSCQVICDSVTCGLQHARPPCPSLSPRVCPSSCPLKQWCHPTFSSSVTLFSFCLQSSPASGSFPVRQYFPDLPSCSLIYVTSGYIVNHRNDVINICFKQLYGL